jgi:membrane protein
MDGSAGRRHAPQDAEATAPDEAAGHLSDGSGSESGPRAATAAGNVPGIARPASAAPVRRTPPWHRRLGSYFGDIARGVWRKGAEDDIFFLAGAISFNILVAFVPLVLAVLGIAGTVLRFQGVGAQEALLEYLHQVIPAAVNVDLELTLQELAARSTGILSVGTLFFLWIATRLVGTLRTVLREIFDLAEGRSIVAGKIFDIKMVLAAGTLFALNVMLTLGLQIAAEFVSGVLGIDPRALPFLGQATQLWPVVLAFVTLWVMFLLIYRYLPPRRIGWRTAVVAATFTSLLVELLKYGFSWYVTGVADFGSAWGNLATFVILVFWIYYTSVVFILGGEVAQVVSMRRIRRRQKERLS